MRSGKPYLQKIFSAVAKCSSSTLWHTERKSMPTRASFALVCSVLFNVASHHTVKAQQANADSHAVGADAQMSPADQRAAAWERLNNGLTGTKNTDTRTATVAALSLLGTDVRAEKLIRDTMQDPDIDLRLAAIVAAGEMAKDQGPRSGLPAVLREQLQDP